MVFVLSPSMAICIFGLQPLPGKDRKSLHSVIFLQNSAEIGLKNRSGLRIAAKVWMREDDEIVAAKVTRPPTYASQ